MLHQRCLCLVVVTALIGGCGSDDTTSNSVQDAAAQDSAAQDSGASVGDGSSSEDSAGGEDTQAPCDPAAAVTETCDGVDNDCDGETDESACDDDNPCTKDTCDPAATTVCSYVDDDGAACEDGDLCTENDSCTGGACKTGAVKDCDDGDLCNGQEACDAGACVAGQGPDCDDGDDCTVDSCDPSDGKCSNVFAKDGTPCDDGKACTAGDACATGVCAGAVSCDDNDPCTNDGCDLSGACTQTANTGESCDDGKVCTTSDACKDGVCEGAVTCDDANPCTEDACDLSGACTNTAVSGGTCDDGNLCTNKETCVAGKCLPGGGTCDDGDPCTADICNQFSGTCSYGSANEGKPCDDGWACTKTSKCELGKCKGDASCDDKNPCTADICDPKTGQCKHIAANDGDACDADGDGCTLNDECKAGACVAGPKVSCQLPDKPCDQITCVSTSATSHKCEKSQKPGCSSAMRTAVADAHVYKYNGGGNYGKSQSMTIDRGNYYIYLKFDLKDVPKNAKVVGAALHMTCYTGYAYGGDGNVYTTLVTKDNWNETSINWNNKPGVSGGSLGHWRLWYNNNTKVNKVKVDTPAFLAAVKGEIAKDGVLSLRLHSPGYKTIYRSREYSKGADRPQLELYYTTK